MESIVDDPETKELQELQPLFKNGLWIFGPEYEAIDFTSNKTLLTVINKLFDGGAVDHPRKRPDFVVLSDSTIGAYSSDQHDNNGEVCGIRKVLILELKRGGSIIKQKERRQAEDYAEGIKKSGKVEQDTEIVCYVLGSKVDSPPTKVGDTINVIPRPYSTVLRQAHARTFNLIKKIKEFKENSGEEATDKEIKEILSQTELEASVN